MMCGTSNASTTATTTPTTAPNPPKYRKPNSTGANIPSIQKTVPAKVNSQAAVVSMTWCFGSSSLKAKNLAAFTSLHLALDRNILEVPALNRKADARKKE